jgi:hypothetical protein
MACLLVGIWNTPMKSPSAVLWKAVAIFEPSFW